MAYAYWKTGRATSTAVFELFFRKNPFEGEFTVFAGLGECVRHLATFRFTHDDIKYLRTQLPTAEPEFFDYLSSLDCSEIILRSLPEGTICFPRTPCIVVEGPLIVVQLLETTLLNLCNYASLMTTNACRFRQAAGPDAVLLEFGLRRAQGPDGGLSASRYSYLGGFNGTSNVLAGQKFGVPIKGTHAHSFIGSFTGLDDLEGINTKIGPNGEDLTTTALIFRKKIVTGSSPNDGELAAFIAYASALPKGFLALIDTYDTLHSGLVNFLAVALALDSMGMKALGVRLDSGDLGWLSTACREKFREVALQFDKPFIAGLTIVASNSINEGVLLSLNDQGHAIDAFGIGTNLVTCQKQPALGMVYKLVEIDNKPRIKISADIAKVTIPGRKQTFRLYGASGIPLLDMMVMDGEAPPVAGQRVLARHPFSEKKRAYVTPSKVTPLLQTYWDGKNGGLQKDLPSTVKVREYLQEEIRNMRSDHLRALNPTPYKVSLSSELYSFFHDLWNKEVPVPELK
eukprot:g2212.t1